MDTFAPGINKLLDGAGRLGGQHFRLVPRATLDAADATLPGLPDAVAIDRAALDNEQAWCTTTHDGGLAGGIGVVTGGEPHVLLALPRTGNMPHADRMQALRDLLEGAREQVTTGLNQAEEADKVTSELNQAYEELYLFSRIATQIRSLHFSPGMFRELLQETREAMRVDVAAALFSDNSMPTLTVAGNSIASSETALVPFLEGLMAAMPGAAAVFEGSSYIVDNSAKHPVFAAMHSRPYRALAIGIRNGEQKYGWLLLISFDMSDIFRRGEYRLLKTMAEQVALVMANTALYKDLEHFVINLVRSLVMAIEAKDDYTRGHSERVSSLCLAMAAELNLAPSEQSNLEWASILHDLGKIGTREDVLNKPGQLTADEFKAIQAHPTKGEEILNPIEQLGDALPAIRHHHEHFDGSGYPDGLAGEAIPLLARIIAVADTYDAITSERAYRKAGTHADAMRIICNCAGSQLDPYLVHVFSRIMEQRTGLRSPQCPQAREEYVG